MTELNRAWLLSMLEKLHCKMEKISAALGAKYFFGFEFEDGTKV